MFHVERMSDIMSLFLTNSYFKILSSFDKFLIHMAEGFLNKNRWRWLCAFKVDWWHHI